MFIKDLAELLSDSIILKAMGGKKFSTISKFENSEATTENLRELMDYVDNEQRKMNEKS